MAGNWWHPAPGLTWQWQLSGRLDTTVDAQVYDIDGMDSRAVDVAALHKAGRKMICYIDVGTFEPWRADANAFPAAVLGKPVTVCSLADLPKFDESVLLDIDVDFLVIPCVSYGESDRHSALPWCWPEELLARLGSCRLRAELVTIAYSVEGGYTPLLWKYLGDELALRLTATACGEAKLAGMSLIHDAAIAAHQGNVTAAEEKYHHARTLLPASAAPCFEPLAWFASGPPNDARKLIAAPAGAPVRRTVKLPPGTTQAGCTVPAKPAPSAGTVASWAIAATATPNTSSLAIVFRFIGIRNPGAVWHSEGPS